MRPLVVILTGFTLWTIALFFGVLSLIRFSPADPEPIAED